MVPDKASFVDYLSQLRITIMNDKDVTLVSPDDSTMEVAVKASIGVQFAILGVSIFGGRKE